MDATNGNGAFLSADGMWTNASDREKKEDFQPIVPARVLERLAMLPRYRLVEFPCMQLLMVRRSSQDWKD